MSNNFQFLEKAALKAAFFIFVCLSTLSPPTRAAVPAKATFSKQLLKSQDQKIIEAKKKITSLLLLKQRSQALEIIQDQLRTNLSLEHQKKISQLKLIVMTSFLTSESQDYFELASSQYLNQTKVALKNVQKCLSIDPDQFMCQWAEIKTHSKFSSRYLAFFEKMKIHALDVPELKPLILSLDKSQKDFINLQFEANSKTELYNAQILLAILEFDRSILAKNYLLARESLDKLQQIAPDYVDIILMRAQLHRHTYGDESLASLNKIVTIYKKKCEAVAPDIARKYFFDIDFCKRTLE